MADFNPQEAPATSLPETIYNTLLDSVYTRKTMRGLVMGRFQPFHNGHLGLIKRTLQECDDIIIAVTGSQFNYIRKDPFTAGERIEMIRNSLLESGIDPRRYIILGIENQQNVYTWLSYLRAALPPFDTIYSGNEYVAMLLADSGISVVSPPMISRQTLNSTSIRNMITQNDDNWRDLVPNAVCDVIDCIGGTSRLKIISKSDTDPTTH